MSSRIINMVIVTNMIKRIYTDGACSNNPGPGGWGIYIEYEDGGMMEICGSEKETTNNRMELTAAIEALKQIDDDIGVEIIVDSMYVQQGITNWINRWKLNGWRTTGRQPVKNIDLWKQLDTLHQEKKVKWIWVKAHNENIGNERADNLANIGMIIN